MTMKRKAAAVWLALVLGCTGCGFMEQPGAYMRLPKLPAEQEALKLTIERSLPEGAALIRPRKAEQKGAYSLIDLDGDGSEEAVFFYKIKNKEQLNGEIWRMKDGSWQRLDRFEGAGFELDSLTFDDVVQKERKDVIAGYSTGAESAKGLAVYSWEAGRMVKKVELPYTDYVIDDLNGDGKKDVTVIVHDRGVSSNATLYQYDNALRKLGSVRLDSTVNDYYNVLGGRVSADKRGVVLDASVGAHSSNTELLVYDAGKLKRALNPQTTYKAYSGKSEDADGDGIIEISGMYDPPGYENEAMVNIPWIETFAKWDGGRGLTTVLERYYSGEYGYTFDIPLEWKDRFTVKKSEASVRFVDTADGKQMAEIRVFPQAEWTDDNQTWTVLSRTMDQVYAIDANGAAYRSFFRLLSEARAEGGSQTHE